MKTWGPWAIVILCIAVLPIAFPSPYLVSIMIFIALYGVLASGMGLLMGQAGLFSLIAPTWFGLGAYTAGILTARGLVSPIAGIAISVVVVCIVAWIIGLPVLRLKGLYLACATFGILIIAQIAFVQLGDLTGGHSGLLGIPYLSIGGFTFDTEQEYYYLSWALCIGTLLFCRNIVESRVGRAIRASHDSETASACMGVNIPQSRLNLFVLTAGMAAVSGSIFGFYLQFISPDIFGFDLLVELTLMCVIGGLGYVWAPLVGCVIISWMHEFFKSWLSSLFPVMTGEVTAIFFGIFIIVVLIFMPQGLVGGAMNVFAKYKGKGRGVS